jgi:hypothetical protein
MRSPLKPKRDRVRRDNRKVKAKEKNYGKEVRDALLLGWWWRKSSLLLEGSLAMPTRPSDRNRTSDNVSDKEDDIFIFSLMNVQIILKVKSFTNPAARRNFD